ncbi:unnamed protein product [Arabidopsis thaliana]|uniref:non-specific serine/threonine protein kinase n=1 Tax=Arabidopsis thaliana TaxID=3702 RepID=A0A7G2FES4_ARATH|nr:unnamed protein product [Arabidopsis thaliana]
MFSPVLFRFSKPNSFLVLLFFLSYIHFLPCAQSQREPCDTLFRCGDLTAGFPFWGVARPQPCGHPSLGLHCQKQTNSTSLIISSLMYRVLEVNTTTSTLKLVRQDFSGPFCSASFSGATLTPELFELLPDYKTLSAYYLCNPSLHYPAKFICPNKGVGSIHQDDLYHNHCGGIFNITVPIGYAPEEGALNVTNLESVLKKGFEVKLSIDERPCQECKTNGGICAYHVATPVCCKTNSSSEVNCTPMMPSGSSVLPQCNQAKIDMSIHILYKFCYDTYHNYYPLGCKNCISRSVLAVLRYTLVPSELKREGYGSLPYQILSSLSTSFSFRVVDEQHKHCSPRFKCGNQSELYYPFWISERKECGHPDFEVNCSGDFAELTVSTVKFQILEMNYEFGIIRLARMDYRNNLCPQHPANASINHDVLPFSPDTKLSTFYHDCQSTVAVHPNDYIKQLNCEDYIGGKSYFVSSSSHSGDRATLAALSASCEGVDIPVSRSALKTVEKNQSLEAMKKAIDEGFELGFNNECSQCAISGGACGFDQRLKAFVCYCADEPHESTCYSEIVKKSLSKKGKIGIGFASGFLGATLIGGCLLCIFIRRRKKLATQYTNKGLSTTTPYSSNYTIHRHDINLANMAISKIQNDAVHELADLSLGFARDPSVKKMMSSVAELAFRCLQQERDVRPSMDEIVEVLRVIQKDGISDSKDVVVEIDVNGGDDVGLLKHGVPPPLSPETDKTTASSSNTTASSF